MLPRLTACTGCTGIAVYTRHNHGRLAYVNDYSNQYTMLDPAVREARYFYVTVSEKLTMCFRMLRADTTIKLECNAAARFRGRYFHSSHGPKSLFS